MDEAKKYIKFISYLQVIGIILVVVGHSFHYYPGGGDHFIVRRLIFSFHMPLFMFVSGFLLVFSIRNKHVRIGFNQFVNGKFKRLLLPFIVLTIVTFVPRSFMSDFAENTVQLNITSFFRAFVFNESLIINYVWYLHSSFSLLVASFIILLLGRKAHISETFLLILLATVFLILSLTPLPYIGFFSFNKTVYVGFYFFLGALFCKYLDQIDSFVPWTSTRFVIISIIAWLWLFFITENTDYSILCACAGIIATTAIAKCLVKKKVSILDHLIGANYMIFLISWYCNITCQQLLHHFIELPWWCYTILSIITGIYIPWLGYKYLQHHIESRWIRLTALLLGQSFRNRS